MEVPIYTITIPRLDVPINTIPEFKTPTDNKI